MAPHGVRTTAPLPWTLMGVQVEDLRAAPGRPHAVFDTAPCSSALGCASGAAGYARPWRGFPPVDRSTLSVVLAPPPLRRWPLPTPAGAALTAATAAATAGAVAARRGGSEATRRRGVRLVSLHAFLGDTAEGRPAGLDINVARVFLVLTAACWATYPVCVKLLAVATDGPLDPTIITVVRFTFMALLSTQLLPSAPEPSDRAAAPAPAAFDSASLAATAAQLSVFGVAGTLLNTWGIEHTSAIRAALLLSTINLFTPILATALGASPEDRDVPVRTWLGCLISFAATAYAVVGGSSGAFGGLQDGDFAVLGAAVCYSLVKVLTGGAARKFPAEALAAGRSFAGAVLAWLVLGGSSLSGTLEADVPATLSHLPAEAWGLLFFSALTSGIIATLLQARGQSVVPPSQAQTVYALVPLLSALYSFILLQEPIEDREVVAGLTILVSAAFSA
mmetsp:Transcript_60096/g.152510  ORF Transcript_60096/g.152510 Transcript_60096/m.152510 type:complete len:449 (-) Transcript_60096:104-1450(-)